MYIISINDIKSFDCTAKRCLYVIIIIWYVIPGTGTKLKTIGSRTGTLAK
jgi:hypothetical protein